MWIVYKCFWNLATRAFLNSAAKRDGVVRRNASGGQRGLLTDAKENGILGPDNVVQASNRILPRMTIKPGLVWGGGRRKHHMRPAQVYLQRWQSATTSLMKLLSKPQTHRDTITHACLESFPFTCLTFQATSFAGCVCGGGGELNSS